MYRPYEFIDPARIAELAERDTCKGCPHERKERFFGADHKTCALGKPHGSRCDNYGRRRLMNILDIGTVKQLDDIDEILVDWYEWSNSDEIAEGYATTDTTCREFRSSRQWDASYLDDDTRHAIASSNGERADAIILSLPADYRIAVNTELFNLWAGYDVRRNPRHPERQASDYADAKLWLRPKFRAKGLL